MPQQLNDLTNKTFGQWFVIRRVEDKVRSNGKRDIYWLCRCACGVEQQVRGSHLNGGTAKSCQSCSSLGRQGALTHGMSRSKAYSSWEHMKKRCFNPNFKQYHDYGGDGITVCEEWMSFEQFYEDMGDPPPGYTLDRIDNDGDYNKANCRWATRAQQTQNRRNVKLNWDKVNFIRNSTHSAANLAAAFEVSSTVIYNIRKNKIWKTMS